MNDADESATQLVKQRVVRLARQMLEGKISFVEGSMKMLELRTGLPNVLPHDKDFEIFMIIYSETDNLPRGAQKEILSKAALINYDKDLIQAQEWARPFAEPACCRLIERFDD